MAKKSLEDVKKVREELSSLDKNLEIVQKKLEEESKIPDLETNTEDVPENGILATIEKGLSHIWAPLRSIVDFLLPYLKDGLKTILTMITSIFSAVNSTLDKLDDLIKKLNPFLIVMEKIQKNIERLIEIISPLALALMAA